MKGENKLPGLEALRIKESGQHFFKTILGYSKVQSTWIYGFSLEEAEWLGVIRPSFIMQKKRERHAQPRKKNGSAKVGDFCGLVIFRSGTACESCSKSLRGSLLEETRE